jgi:ABC-2 type transport system ATP-binding protein
MPALDVRGVTKAYATKTAVDGVSLAVEEGEIFGLLGPNGAGKSTLIRMVMDMIRPDAGEIRLFDRPRSPALRELVGYLPEERGLYQRQRVIEVLRYLGELKGLDRALASRRAEEWLDRVGLLSSRDKRMRELSKGMQQKAQLAAILMTRPRLMILDEPFEGLDPVNRVAVTDLVKEAAADGATVVLSSHRMDQVESLCRRVFLINGGKEILSGELRALRERFADNAVYLEGEPAADGHPDVVRAEPRGPGAKLWLRDGVRPEALLSSLIAAGTRIARFERALPSLDEIFVRSVSP